jgi:hypothetical protein
MSVKRWRPGLMGLLGSCALYTVVAQAAAAEHVYAARVPGGAVRVLYVTEGAWPAGGLRIEDVTGTVLVPHVEASGNAAELDAASQNALRALQHPRTGSDPQAKTANAILVLRVLSDWAFARAAGLAAELPPGAHPNSIRVVVLNANGETATSVGPVTVRDDPGPPATAGLRAEARPAGVVLQWQTAPVTQAIPVFGYTVQRAVGAEHDALTLHPQLLAVNKPGQPMPFWDHAPPVGTAVTYELRLVDVLGVPGTAASTLVFSPDFAAAAPPAGQVASAGRGIITLSWTPLANSRTAGLMVERAQLADGPYEWLTPQGLAPQSARFEDHNVLPGASYYYRVRAVAPDGSLGPAPDPVRAQSLAPGVLAAPQGLSAETGASQITLTWKAVAGAELAGYIVERRATATAPRWARLNSRLLPDARYLDVIGPGAGGSFDYRITAVASDEGHSAPSAVLHVALRDTRPPAAPRVLSASGSDGRVQIRFAAVDADGKTTQVALLRSDSPSEAGLVVGAPVAAASGMIEDAWAQHAGQRYWYRLVAFDKDGNRSAASDAYAVRVSAVSLPAPAAPTVVYAAQPAAQATVRFGPPPPHVRVIVQVQLGDGRWRSIAGPTTDSPVVDAAPPSAHASYRVVYVAEAGGPGKASDAASAR